MADSPKSIKVILKLDIYHHVRKAERFWQREVWIGEMPVQSDAREYDPLLLSKEHAFGAENVIFRLDEHRKDKNELIYRPVVFHTRHWFLEVVSRWGFHKESSVNKEFIIGEAS